MSRIETEHYRPIVAEALAEAGVRIKPPRILQQQWVTSSGQVEWRDVETVEGAV